MEQTLLAIVLAPLAAAIVAGLFGRVVGRAGAHTVTILGVAISFGLSAKVFWDLLGGAPAFDGPVYTWLVSDGLRMEIGFLVDRLSALMMVVVTFVSLMVHVYTIGYMHEDPGYTRFFSYISLFTFAMLMLVMSNNLLQLFFGWEAVGLVSYLLIGFWYTRPTAIVANLKAFLVNRVGDFGFLLGIAGIAYLTGSLHYAEIFGQADAIAAASFELIPGVAWSAITVICICLFIGAMGKSAQVPLHVWLPDSMEGPTPISALIHAATMVTAGIFMVARMSPLFELSETALSFVIVIGGTTALFMGFLGIVSNDIKRVVAYSTLSQLGYMTVALGVSAYAGAIFHLMTHAFFKALLFLAAGSVIIAMHHEQDMRKMGGLRKYMPITYWTCLIGALALIGFPGFAGFFSKDALIEAVELSTLPAARYGYWCVLIGVFVTAFYTFRLVFMTFHGQERMDEHTREHLHESPWVVTLPLVLLAIPSVIIGWPAIGTLAVRRLLRQRGLRRAGARRARAARRALPRASGVRAARPRFADSRPRGRRRHAGLVPVPEAAGARGAAACEGGGPVHAARQQVLHRRVQRAVHRRRQPRAWQPAVARWRRGDHRRRRRQRFGAPRRLDRRRDSRRPVRLPLSLCLRDDHWPLGAARVAPLAKLTHAS